MDLNLPFLAVGFSLYAVGNQHPGLLSAVEAPLVLRLAEPSLGKRALFPGLPPFPPQEPTDRLLCLLHMAVFSQFSIVIEKVFLGSVRLWKWHKGIVSAGLSRPTAAMLSLGGDL